MCRYRKVGPLQMAIRLSNNQNIVKSPLHFVYNSTDLLDYMKEMKWHRRGWQNR